MRMMGGMNPMMGMMGGMNPMMGMMNPMMGMTLVCTQFFRFHDMTS